MQPENTIKEYEVGKPFLLGRTALSEEEIIVFAKAFDPLIFHIDREAAKKSMFGGLIASGPHIFQLMHCKFWIPLFGKSVVAGLEVNNWKFLKPVYPNKEVECYLTIRSRKLNSDNKTATITWLYEFRYTGKTELIQSLEMTIMHTL